MKVKKKAVGRPKMPKSLKKVGFSIKVRPVLLDNINRQTEGKNRNQEIETLLEQKYL